MREMVKVFKPVWENWLRTIVMGISMLGIFFGLLLIESNFPIGAIITIVCGFNALAMEKGIY